ncbi:MAG: ATP-dependent DNA ligase, partial [Flavipsychrobacter sp.]
MKDFSRLFTEIDQTTSTNDKIDALARYFEIAAPEDATWCVALLTGKRPKRTIRSGELRDWCSQLINIPVWLMEESYHVVGDLAETITLLLPEPEETTEYRLSNIITDLMALQDKAEDVRRTFIINMWQQLGKQELFIFNKLITGNFRMGVSDKIVMKALAKAFAIDENIVAHRLSGNWDPLTTRLDQLLGAADTTDDISRPSPFYLAYPLETELQELGAVE